MSITIRKQLAAYWFPLDKEDPASAAFHVRPLTQLQLHEVRRHMGFTEFARLEISMLGIEHAFAYGLIGWRNVLDEDGKELECTRINQVNLDMKVLTVVASEIVNASMLTAEQKKS